MKLILITIPILLACSIRKSQKLSVKKDSSSNNQKQINTLTTDLRNLKTYHHQQDSSITKIYTFAKPVTLKEIKQEKAPIISLKIIQQTHKHTDSNKTKIQYKQSKNTKQHTQILTQQQLINTNQIQRKPSYSYIIWIAIITISIYKIKKYIRL